MNTINSNNPLIHAFCSGFVAVLLCLTVSSFAFAQSAQEKSEFEKQREAYSAQFRQEASNYAEQFRNDWQNYKRSIREKWGYAEVSTARKIVVYSPDKTMKVAIDFEHNQIKAGFVNQAKVTTEQLVAFISAVLVRPANAPDTPEPQSDSSMTIAASIGLQPADISPLAESLATTATSVSTKEDAQQTADDIKEQADAIKRHAKQIEEPKERRKEQEFAEQLVKEEKQTARVDPREKSSTIKKLSIDDDRLNRAMRYHEIVEELAKEYGLAEALIFAVMETESSFNPSAMSPIPAFGLMQIVPTTAGLDVNQRILNTSKAPSKEELFDAKTNVVFGSAYIHLVMNRYFSKITSAESQLYCAIAAYNTGPGNVARTFNQSQDMSLSKMAATVNTMDPEQVKAFLIENLPADETRRYIQKVLNAQQFYSAQ